MLGLLGHRLRELGDAQVAQGVAAGLAGADPHGFEIHLAAFEFDLLLFAIGVQAQQHPGAGFPPQDRGGLVQAQVGGELAVDSHHGSAAGDACFGGGRSIQRGDHHDGLVAGLEPQLQPNPGHRALGVGPQGGVVRGTKQAGVGVAQGRQH